MLGTGGERVDVLAHFFGFLFGGVLGLLFAFVTPRPPGFRIQCACGGRQLLCSFLAGFLPYVEAIGTGRLIK